jgi:hypothetical protein
MHLVARFRPLHHPTAFGLPGSFYDAAMPAALNHSSLHHTILKHIM